MSKLIPYNVYFNGTSPIKSESASLGLPTALRKLTMVVRAKLTETAANQRVFTDVSGRQMFFKNSAANQFRFSHLAAGAANASAKIWTDATLMDGEYHNFVSIVDVTTGNTAADCKVFVDGVKVTSFDTDTFDAVDLDADAQQWIVGGTNAGTDLFTGGVSIAAVYGDVISADDATIISTFFDSDGNLTDPGLDGTNWFGAPAPVIYRPTISNRIRNMGNYGGDFNTALGGGEFPILDSPVAEARIPMAQAGNYRYKAINDIDVVDNGDGTSTITSAGSGFSVYNATTNPAGLKVGDYITATGSVSNVYPITAVAAGSITVTGAMTAYAKAATEYASVYRVGRRPT